MWTEEAFQLTISGLLWVTAMDWGNVDRFLRGYTQILLMISPLIPSLLVFLLNLDGPWNASRILQTKS